MPEQPNAKLRKLQINNSNKLDFCQNLLYTSLVKEATMQIGFAGIRHFLPWSQKEEDVFLNQTLSAVLAESTPIKREFLRQCKPREREFLENLLIVEPRKLFAPNKFIKKAKILGIISVNAGIATLDESTATFLREEEQKKQNAISAGESISLIDTC